MFRLNSNHRSRIRASFRIFTTLTVFLLSVFMVTPVQAYAPAVGTVVEGTSVPGVSLGFTRTQVEAAWGPPEYCRNVSSIDQASCRFETDAGGPVDIRYAGPDGGSATNSPDDVVRVIYWYQNVSGWVTTAGVNTTLAYNDPDAVLAAYPNATIHQQSLFGWSIDEPVLGIHIFYHTAYLTGELSVSMSITEGASEYPPPEDHYTRVTGIDLAVDQRNEVTAAVHVVDENGEIPYAATVWITWTTPKGDTLALRRLTDDSGAAWFDLGKLKGRGVFTLTVDNVDYGSYRFNVEESVTSATLFK